VQHDAADELPHSKWTSPIVAPAGLTAQGESLDSREVVEVGVFSRARAHAALSERALRAASSSRPLSRVSSAVIAGGHDEVAL